MKQPKVCSILRDDNGCINAIVLDLKIRCYNRDNVDGRFDGPFCDTPEKVYLHLGTTKVYSYCLVPVELARAMFPHWEEMWPEQEQKWVFNTFN